MSPTPRAGYNPPLEVAINTTSRQVRAEELAAIVAGSRSARASPSGAKARDAARSPCAAGFKGPKLSARM